MPHWCWCRVVPKTPPMECVCRRRNYMAKSWPMQSLLLIDDRSKVVIKLDNQNKSIKHWWTFLSVRIAGVLDPYSIVVFGAALAPYQCYQIGWAELIDSTFKLEGLRMAKANRRQRQVAAERCWNKILIQLPIVSVIWTFYSVSLTPRYADGVLSCDISLYGPICYGE